VFHRFNEKARDALDRAAKKAKELRHQAVEPEHILASLAESAGEPGETSFHSLLKSFDIPKEAVTEQLEPVPAPPGTPVPKDAVFSPEAKRVLEFAVEEADKLGHKRIGTSHFLLAFIRDELEGDSGAQTLTSLGLGLEDVRARVRELAEHEGAGKADVVPSILFFELDRRAREAEQNLSARVEQLEAETHELRAKLEELTARLGSADGGAAGAEKAGASRRKRGES
jgi:ATP-dependent Clp protease ATP-binding subunit ClpA